MPKGGYGLGCFWLFVVVLSVCGEARSCPSTFVIVCCLLSAFLSSFLSEFDLYRLVLIVSYWGDDAFPLFMFCVNLQAS